MKKIKEFRLSLMEKEGTKSEEEGKENYIVRSSASLELEKYLLENKIEGSYSDFVLGSANMIFGELINRKEKEVVDTVGLWIVFEDDFQVDNAIDLETLDQIRAYGPDDVEPFQEFFKMTVDLNESEAD